MTLWSGVTVTLQVGILNLFFTFSRLLKFSGWSSYVLYDTGIVK